MLSFRIFFRRGALFKLYACLNALNFAVGVAKYEKQFQRMFTIEKKNIYNFCE